MTFLSIPVIDIAGLRSDDRRDHLAISRKIHHACSSAGFFYIANHGVLPELIRQTLAAAQQFFKQPAALKNEVALCHSTISRGYESIGAQALDQMPDLKEGYYIGVERGVDDPLVRAEIPNHGPNQWPRLPGWRQLMEAYFATMLDLSRRLLRGMALALELDQHHFDRSVDNPMAILRLLHYPPLPSAAPPEQLGCGAHTDWGCLTVLWQDQAGGLEVQSPQGEWIRAEPVVDTFVVNLGDMMARWTNDRYQSTPHRVQSRAGCDRYSMAFFLDPNYHTVIECLPTCQTAARRPKYPPIMAGQYIMDRYRETYQTLA